MTGLLTAPAPAPAPAAHKPYAAPLIAVDAHQIVDAGEITATKAIRADDPYLEGHYPDFTIYPGVFVIESAVQTVRLLAAETMDDPGDLVLSAVPSVRFVNPLLPGDTLHIRCRCTLGEDGVLLAKADCSTGSGAKAAQMKLEFRRSGQIPAAHSTHDAHDAHDAAGAPGSVLFDHAQLRDLLPHRHPILLVDAVERIDPGSRIIATKAVTGSEPCYAGIAESDDPRRYAYPRSLIIESFGQTGAVLWLESLRRSGREVDGSLIFGAARDVTFHREARPGDVLRHEAVLDQVVGDNAFLRGRTLVGGEVAVEYGSCIAVVRRTDTLGS